MRRSIWRTLSALGLLALPATAMAGGYDTPILYSARHMGAGGAAVAFVDDASAMYHNPAGIAQVDRGSLLLDVSIVYGRIQGSPADLPAATSIESEPTVAPFFLLGGAYRLTDYLVAGIGVYPVTAAGADYVYGDASCPDGECVDNTTLIFFEATVGLALDFEPLGVPGLRIGATWRATYVSLSREQQYNPNPALQPNVDFKLTGINLRGFKIGVQYQPIDELELGINWRSRTSTEVDTSDGVVFGASTGVETEFDLPDRLVFGVRGNFGDFSAMSDLEIGFNGENDTQQITLTNSGAEVPNILRWKHAPTLRLGGEYRIPAGEARVPVRLGYIFDAKTANSTYPTAFGTPPGPTHTITVGAGYAAEDWQINVAYAYRNGDATVTGADPACVFCGKDGDYELTMNGMYADFSYAF